jgi:hypothetical protein
MMKDEMRINMPIRYVVLTASNLRLIEQLN